MVVELHPLAPAPLDVVVSFMFDMVYLVEYGLSRHEHVPRPQGYGIHTSLLTLARWKPSIMWLRRCQPSAIVLGPGFLP